MDGRPGGWAGVVRMEEAYRRSLFSSPSPSIALRFGFPCSCLICPRISGIQPLAQCLAQLWGCGVCGMNQWEGMGCTLCLVASEGSVPPPNKWEELFAAHPSAAALPGWVPDLCDPPHPASACLPQLLRAGGPSCLKGKLRPGERQAGSCPTSLRAGDRAIDQVYVLTPDPVLLNILGV